MLRKKILGDMPHPNYSVCNYWYTLKLRHGGVTLHLDDDSFEYYGGSVSTFDFVDCRNWGKQYLVGLCEELGYVGEKTKFLFGLDSNGRLKALETEHDLMMLVIRAQFSRELYVVLECDKDQLVSEEDTVEGEDEYVDENVVVDAASDAVVDRLQRKYFLTYIDINSDRNSIVMGSDDVVSSVDAAANRSFFKPPEQMILAKRKVTSAVHVGKPTIQLTEPPPTSFHPGQSSSIAKVAEKEKEHGELRVFTAKGGNKFTNLSSLRVAARQKKGGKS